MEWPRMTHDMLRNRIPLTAFKDPFGWAVLRILFPLEYMEKANRILATTSVIDQTLQTCQSYSVLYGIESTFTFGIHVMTKINEIEILHYLNQYFKKFYERQNTDEYFSSLLYLHFLVSVYHLWYFLWHFVFVCFLEILR